MEDRRRDKGSGIGKSHGEGGTNKESPIREKKRETEGGKRGRCREMEKVGGRNRLSERDREESEAVGCF
ncbi:hypothetical protein DVA81_18700, partial [Acinetobacter baumannii]